MIELPRLNGPRPFQQLADGRDNAVAHQNGEEQTDQSGDQRNRHRNARHPLLRAKGETRIGADQLQQFGSDGVDFEVERLSERIDLLHFRTIKFCAFLLQRLDEFLLRVV